MDEHEMEIAKKANKYLYGISDHEKVKKALELIDEEFDASVISDTLDDEEKLDELGRLRHIVLDVKKILETQKKTTAFGFD